MANWELVPCLVRLRSELNEIAPNRDKTSDGTIGDRAHQQNVSDHNDDEVGRVPIRDADSKHEVHAFDGDSDLRERGLDMEMVVQHILARCRSGAEKRLRYIIYNRRIWEASNSWKQRAYTGASPHTGHAHFSSSYETKREADTSSWKLEDIEVALTAADKNWIKTQIDEGAERAATVAAQKVWATRLDVNIDPKGKASLQPAGSILRYLSPEGHKTRDLLNTVINLLKGGTK